MSGHQFYLSEMGFVSLILILLSLTVTVYLIKGRSLNRSGWLLIGFFVAVIANSVTMLVANGWIFWGSMLMPGQDAWIILGGVPLAQFAYHTPRYDQKHEARIVLAITGVVALFAIGYSLYYAVSYLFFYQPGMEESQAYYLLLPLMTLFVFAVFLRRASFYSRENSDDVNI